MRNFRPHIKLNINTLRCIQLHLNTYSTVTVYLKHMFYNL